MTWMSFDTVDAAAFALVDLESGSRVGAAHLRSQVRALLRQSREEEPDRLAFLVVVAVDDMGQEIESWSAPEILGATA